MAKKKKNARKKKSEPEIVEQSNFWAYAGAIIMMLAAVFLMLGGFGAGGPLPKSMFAGTYWVFGWAAYLTPVALIFGVY